MVPGLEYYTVMMGKAGCCQSADQRQLCRAFSHVRPQMVSVWAPSLSLALRTALAPVVLLEKGAFQEGASLVPG